MRTEDCFIRFAEAKYSCAQLNLAKRSKPKQSKAMTISIKDYFATKGSRFTKDDAAVIGPELQELAASGQTNANSIVEVARSSNSPLHRYFEWDDKKAAHQYRLGQADDIVLSIRVRLESGDDQPANQKIIMRVTSDIVPRPGSAIPAKTEGDGQEKRIGEALADLDKWMLRYRPYGTIWASFGIIFEPVFAAIEAARKRRSAPGNEDPPPLKVGELPPRNRPTHQSFKTLDLPKQHSPAVMRAARELAESRGKPCQIIGGKFRIGDQVMTAEQVLAEAKG